MCVYIYISLPTYVKENSHDSTYKFNEIKRKMNLLDWREIPESNFKLLVKRRSFEKMDQSNEEFPGECLWEARISCYFPRSFPTYTFFTNEG